MATFGTVVPGVGTFHAPFGAWGVAATFQKLAAVGVTYSGSAFVAAGTALLAKTALSFKK